MPARSAAQRQVGRLGAGAGVAHFLRAGNRLDQPLGQSDRRFVQKVVGGAQLDLRLDRR